MFVLQKALTKADFPVPKLKAKCYKLESTSLRLHKSTIQSRHGHRSKKFLAATYMKQYDVKST